MQWQHVVKGTLLLIILLGRQISIYLYSQHSSQPASSQVSASEFEFLCGKGHIHYIINDTFFDGISNGFPTFHTFMTLGTSFFNLL